MNSQKLVVVLATVLMFAQSTAYAMANFSISKVISAQAHPAEQVRKHAEKVDIDFSSFAGHTRRVEINATTNPRNIFSAIK